MLVLYGSVTTYPNTIAMAWHMAHRTRTAVMCVDAYNIVSPHHGEQGVN